MSISEQDVLRVLHSIQSPGGAGSLVEAGTVRRIDIEDGAVHVSLAVTSTQPGDSHAVRDEVERRLRDVGGVDSAEVEVQTLLSTVQPTPRQPAQPAPQQQPSWAAMIPEVRRVVAVASGKGGVGKSTVAANLALALAGLDRSVGLLDADIYGPSQQLMMGTHDEPMGDESGKIYPVEAAGGVKVMSFGFIVDADQPVIWRGPMLQKALEQFFGDVVWGALDTLIVDLPPGTGDVALTLSQNVPMAGAIIVTTPQDVALIDARKSLHMFRKLEVPVIGIVENMSQYECPECGHVEHVFGSGGGQRTADSLGVPFLCSIPLDPSIVVGGDSGRPVVVERPDSPAAMAFKELAGKLGD